MLQMLHVPALECALFTKPNAPSRRAQDICKRQRPPLKKWATSISQRRSTIGARTKKHSPWKNDPDTQKGRNVSIWKVEHLRKKAQSNNDASNVAMAPSRRETAKDYFSPRMAVDTTPQDHAADAPRVD